ncbi:MAG: heme-binding domain-containing protein [Paludibacteraceae bacterium]|nr:heme-binding domain-containing protein [Paludibacteraceae bacterium]
MKKTRTLWIIVAVLVVAIAAIAVYRFSCRKSIPEASTSEQVAAILRQNDCYICHSAVAEKPFYTSFPIIGTSIQGHITHAQGFISLDEATIDLENPSEVLLAMMEHCTAYETMPIAEYKMIHWGTGFNKEERDIIMRWVNEKRINLYASGLAANEFANEPIQVLPSSIPTDSAKVALGEFMYNDPRISLDSTISCATCHILKDGGADEPSDRTSGGINGQFGGVNAPTVYNSFFNIQQFWNGRAADLAAQAAGPPTNPIEMGDQTWDQIVERLRQDPELVARFLAIYPDEGLTEHTVTEVIAEFEKTLLTPDSRFDLYLKGDKSQLNKEEIEGYELFKANSCAACHIGKILGGQSFELLGIYEDYFAARDKSIKYNGDDDGLKGFTGNDADLHRFKVPGLRNIEYTAPYFHDGSQATLEDAVRAMYRYELGRTPSDKDVARLVAFMKTLNGINPHLQK